MVGPPCAPPCPCRLPPPPAAAATAAPAPHPAPCLPETFMIISRLATTPKIKI